MSPKPIYRPESLEGAAFQLRYTWTGWPSDGHFPARPPAEMFETLTDRWETDGIRLLERDWSSERVQLTVSVDPEVAPTRFTARMKGRLQHALRQHQAHASFSRKVSMGSVGDTCREDVERYLARQVAEARFVDSSFAELLERYSTFDRATDLSEPVATKSGRYVYNLHLVLVARESHCFADEEQLERLYEQGLAVAEVKEHRLAALSVMPDHVHLALGGDIRKTPEEMALCYMNNLAWAVGQKEIWRPSYYAGTFGEYDMWAVR